MESLQEVKRRLDVESTSPNSKQIRMENFRANVVVEGRPKLKPFAEDNWSDVQILSNNDCSQISASFRVPFPPCARCQVPTNNIESGQFDKYNEPTRTMNAFRRGNDLIVDKAKAATLRPKDLKQVYFGINLVVGTNDVLGIEREMEISVGDNVLGLLAED